MSWVTHTILWPWVSSIHANWFQGFTWKNSSVRVHSGPYTHHQRDNTRQAQTYSMVEKSQNPRWRFTWALRKHHTFYQQNWLWDVEVANLSWTCLKMQLNVKQAEMKEMCCHAKLDSPFTLSSSLWWRSICNVKRFLRPFKFLSVQKQVLCFNEANSDDKHAISIWSEMTAWLIHTLST